jgi:hypothetical protein
MVEVREVMVMCPSKYANASLANKPTKVSQTKCRSTYLSDRGGLRVFQIEQGLVNWVGEVVWRGVGKCEYGQRHQRPSHS